MPQLRGNEPILGLNNQAFQRKLKVDDKKKQSSIAMNNASTSSS
jgi:hypothetical protein